MKKNKICNYVCIALMAILFVLQFMPFWSYDGVSVSIQSYVWFPANHTTLDTYIGSQISGYSINDIVWMPVITLVATVGGIILFVKAPDNAYVGIVPLICGIIGTWAYMTKEPLHLGTNWVLHLVVCIAMVVVSFLRTIWIIKEKKSSNMG